MAKDKRFFKVTETPSHLVTKIKKILEILVIRGDHLSP